MVKNIFVIKFIVEQVSSVPSKVFLFANTKCPPAVITWYIQYQYISAHSDSKIKALSYFHL